MFIVKLQRHEDHIDSTLTLCTTKYHEQTDHKGNVLLTFAAGGATDGREWKEHYYIGSNHHGDWDEFFVDHYKSSAWDSYCITDEDEVIDSHMSKRGLLDLTARSDLGGVDNVHS